MMNVTPAGTWGSRTTRVLFLITFLASPTLATAQGDRASGVMAVIAAPGLAVAGGDPIADPAQPPRVTRPATPTGDGYFTEPKFIENGISLAVDRIGEGGGTKEGWYPQLSNNVTGAGVVSIGPGYRKYVLNRQAFWDVSGAVSWHLYNMAQGRFEFPSLDDGHLTLGTQVTWQDQTQINYFGLGPDTNQDFRSQYQMKYGDLTAYANYQLTSSLMIGGKVGWLNNPKIQAPGGTFKPIVKDTTVAFPNDPAVGLVSQPSYFHAIGLIADDTRDYPGHPTEGGLYRTAVTMYSDRDAGSFSFQEYEAEAMHFWPVGDSRDWVLAARGWILASNVPTGHEIPFYLMPSIGGQNTLRGYSTYEFHDQNVALVGAESRWALSQHIDGALFFDAGNVARATSDLNLDKTDWGLGLRLHTQRTPFARVDVAHGSEGWNVVFRTTEPFRLTRLMRRFAVVPFVP
jgi:hypothetical protein